MFIQVCIWVCEFVWLIESWSSVIIKGVMIIAFQLSHILSFFTPLSLLLAIFFFRSWSFFLSIYLSFLLSFFLSVFLSFFLTNSPTFFFYISPLHCSLFPHPWIIHSPKAAYEITKSYGALYESPPPPCCNQDASAELRLSLMICIPQEGCVWVCERERKRRKVCFSCGPIKHI